MNPQQIINESRPMLEEFLSDIGLYSLGSPLDLQSLLGPFSSWVDEQDVAEDLRFYLASRLAAFICEYLIDFCSGERLIDNGRIIMRLPIQEGLFREFDPYAVAVEMATDRKSLKEFIDRIFE